MKARTYSSRCSLPVWHAMIACALLGASTATSPILAQTPAPPAASNEAATAPAIEQGREALNQSWFTPPWYDSERDSVKRITVKPEWDFWEGWDFSGWDLTQWGLPDMSLLEWLAWIVVSLLLAAISYVLVRAWLQRDANVTGRSSASSAQEDEADEARVEALPFQVARRASDFLAEADRYRRAGNFREAIIYLFSHQLVSLDRRQRIRLTKGKTNRQYLRELSRQVALRSLVEETMVTFEDVFFGDHPLDAAGFERCWKRLGEFDQLIEQEAA